MRAARAEPRPLTRLAVELLARTGMRVGELCALEADAVVLIGETHWLRIPVGKLHNDRYIPLHPQLVDMLGEWALTPNACRMQATGALSAKVEKVWHIAPKRVSKRGRKVCKVCQALAGDRVRDLDRPFRSAVGPLLIPPAHPNCRCSFTVHDLGSARLPGANVLVRASRARDERSTTSRGLAS